MDRGKELLTITVEIGDGQRENILIYENDTADQVAEEFCSKYVNISEDLKDAFTQQIDENMWQVKAEMTSTKELYDKVSRWSGMD